MNSTENSRPGAPQPSEPTRILPQVPWSTPSSEQTRPHSPSQQTPEEFMTGGTLPQQNPAGATPQAPSPYTWEHYGAQPGQQCGQPFGSSHMDHQAGYSQWPTPQPSTEHGSQPTRWAQAKQPPQQQWSTVSQPLPGQAYPWGSQPAAPPPKKKRGYIVLLVAALLIALVAAAAGAVIDVRQGKSGTTASSTQARGEGGGSRETSGLRITFKSSEARYYKLEFSQQGTLTGEVLLADDSGPLDTKMSMTSDMTLQVLERLPGGATRIKLTLSNTQVALSMNGRQQHLPENIFDSLEIIFRVNPDGTFEMEDSGGGQFLIPGVVPSSPVGGGSPFGLNAPAPILPDHPIKPGDSWNKTIETKVPGLTKPLQITTQNTYVRDEDTSWGQAMLISSKSSVTLNLSDLDTSELDVPESFTYSGVITADTLTRFWFVPELGEAVKMVVDPSSSVKGSMKFSDPSAGMSQAQSFETKMDMTMGMTMERQSSPSSPGSRAKKTPALSS